jgi:hypothetical protein
LQTPPSKPRGVRRSHFNHVVMLGVIPSGEEEQGKDFIPPLLVFMSMD